jgi:hypothetical protein
MSRTAVATVGPARFLYRVICGTSNLHESRHILTGPPPPPPPPLSLGRAV